MLILFFFDFFYFDTLAYYSIVRALARSATVRATEIQNKINIQIFGDLTNQLIIVYNPNDTVRRISKESRFHCVDFYLYL